MEAVIGLLVMILGVSHGVETYCDGRQDGAQCYGALGGTVVLQLMDNTSGISRYQWSIKTTINANTTTITTILSGSNNPFVFNAIENRSFFTPSNGTFRINNLSWTDGGEYKLEIIGSDGLVSEQRTLQLTIQAPVSSVLLVSECLSQGEMRVSCSSKGGDSPQYSWTLDGRTLTDAELLSGNTETDSITLKQNVSGRLVCSVRNKVSNVSEEKTLSTCGVETYCDGQQDGAQCYGALGGTVVLQLMDNASEIFRYTWSRKTTKIVSGRKNMIMFNEIENRSFFTPSDGTFRINNLSWTDGGEYKLEIFDSDGKISEQRTLQLTIQAPVSSVLLVSECLSQGEMRVSCSSEGGDSPQYSWTLDGRTLTDAELLSGNTETDSITLKQNVSGRLVCSVRNQVSNVSEEKTISTCGVETYCDGRQDGAQCYGALGGTVVLQLMDNTSGISRYQWSIKTTINANTTTITTILSGSNNPFVFNAIENRSFFTPSNGTFRINNLSWTDGGEYKLEIFGSDGLVSEQRTLQLTIQAPVSSVLLVSECLSQGEMRVSCSSKGGDSPQYSWTLDGRTLTDAELLSGNTETDSITLKQNVSGRLVCSVRNQVSNVSEEKTLSTCGFIFINCTLKDGTNISQWVFPANNTLCVPPTTAPTTSTYTSTVGYLPIMAGVLSALVILLVVGVAVVCAQKKKQNNKPKEEEDHELTYADVRFAQRPGRQVQQRAKTEVEVEYGQVKFSERPQQTVEPAGDECVYAKVRRDR
ncbi:hemicentin-1 [Sander lucioperca]|uniref:hemicentin-1 n=1 Tax=Sander lucioperca TaxID=283035 RepID=UPI001653CC74|nr:hemicentin-1 [Sander lucioperca]